MKKYLIFLLFILTNINSGYSYKIHPITLKIGEKYYYNIYVLGAKVAAETITISKETNILSKKCYKIITLIKTTPFISEIYKVEDYIETYIEKNSLLPVLIHTKLHERKWENEIIIKINQEKKFLWYKDKKINKKFYFEHKLLGLVSILFYLKKITPEKGEIINLYVHNKRKVEKLITKVISTNEIIKAQINNKKKKFKVFHYKTINKNGAELWISNDKDRLPLKLISIKIPVFGDMSISIISHLIKIENIYLNK